VLVKGGIANSQNWGMEYPQDFFKSILDSVVGTGWNWERKRERERE